MTALAGFAAILVSWGWGPRALAAAVTWDQLPDLVEAAPATKAEDAEAQAAEARTGYLARSWQPRIDAAASGTRRSVTDPEGVLEPAAKRTMAAGTGVAANLNLWRAGRDMAKDAALNELASARQHAATQQKANRLLAARRAWLEAWQQKGLADLLAASTELTRANRERAARKARSGLTTQSDVMEFDLRLLALEQQTAETGEAERQAEADMAALLGVPGATVISATSLPDWPPAQEAPVAVGLLELSLSGEGRSVGLERRSLGGWPYPEVGLGLIAGQGGRWQAFPAEQQAEAGVGLTLSLWDGGAASAEGRALDRQAESFRQAAEAARASRAAELDLTAYRLRLWQERSVRLGERVRLATEFRTSVSEEYLRGVKDSRDLEDATREVFEAGAAQQDVRVRAWAAWADWQAANAK